MINLNTEVLPQGFNGAESKLQSTEKEALSQKNIDELDSSVEINLNSNLETFKNELANLVNITASKDKIVVEDVV